MATKLSVILTDYLHIKRTGPTWALLIYSVKYYNKWRSEVVGVQILSQNSLKLSRFINASLWISIYVLLPQFINTFYKISLSPMENLPRALQAGHLDWKECLGLILRWGLIHTIWLQFSDAQRFPDCSKCFHIIEHPELCLSVEIWINNMHTISIKQVSIKTYLFIFPVKRLRGNRYNTNRAIGANDL